jgi:predicted nucleotidyltransferase
VTTEDIVARMRAALAREPNVRFALLFGSAARRGPEHARDLDVAVAFGRSTSLFELGRVEGALEAAVGREVDLVDLADASTLLRWEVAREGKVICSSDRPALVTFLARAPLEWDDLRPFYERETAGLARRLGCQWSKSTS